MQWNAQIRKAAAGQDSLQMQGFASFQVSKLLFSILLYRIPILFLYFEYVFFGVNGRVGWEKIKSFHGWAKMQVIRIWH